MTDLRICLRKKNFVIQDYDDGRKQIKDQNGNKLQFKYKKEAITLKINLKNMLRSV